MGGAYCRSILGRNKKELLAMSRKKPSKKELARMKAMSELGESPNAIAKRMRKSHNTVQKYLASDVYNDPEIAGMVETIKEKELADLYLLGAKGRHRLHELVDEGKTKMIETIALVDRVFQQRRLLEGNSTQNIHTLSKVIEAAQESGDNALRSMSITINQPNGATAVAISPQISKKENPGD
jgi:hypothetical protein